MLVLLSSTSYNLSNLCGSAIGTAAESAIAMEQIEAKNYKNV
jgi:hypothetical protein